MAELKDIIAKILKDYPNPDDLSNARVTKLIYLSDWHHAIHKSKQISSIDWYFDNYGPFVWDVKVAVESNPELFNLAESNNMFGSNKTVFKLKNRKFAPSLSASESASIKFILNATKDLGWNKFIKLVYSTYPIASSEKYSHLNLIAKSNEYKNI